MQMRCLLGTPTSCLFSGSASECGTQQGNYFCRRCPTRSWAQVMVVAEADDIFDNYDDDVLPHLVSCGDVPHLLMSVCVWCMREVVVHCQGLAQPSF